MTNSIASINSLLVGLKNVNGSLLIKLHQLGFNTNLSLGAEQEYTVKTLVNAINTLTIQLLTITSNRSQFIQRTSYPERLEIESCLNSLLSCTQQTKQELNGLQRTQFQCDSNKALCYISNENDLCCFKLLDTLQFIDLIKPYCRMLEMIIAEERIHALSAVIDTLMNKQDATIIERDNELTEEQYGALELSHYLMKQAM
ncbi:hypothetical protein MNBD_GAMMA07-574 [hydrothermal vent metagenome]|uniref:Uncharacterized protein n=1 Tax=hydrothermal vent metagenome TaxID=652676 RepID=A0A3B0WKI2_9ZZZZ